MRRKHHRLLCIAIALLLAAALLCTPAAAAQSGSCGQGLQWQLSGGVLRITGTGALPSYTDNSMPPWYGSAGSITTVIVGSGVTAIGDLAFYGCTALTAVRLPDSVTAIGTAAFKDCSALGSIALRPRCFPSAKPPLKTVRSWAVSPCPRGFAPSAALPSTAARGLPRWWFPPRWRSWGWWRLATAPRLSVPR